MNSPSLPFVAAAVVLLFVGGGCQRANQPGGAAMTRERFNQIAESPGDAIPLSPQLAVLPFWTDSAAHLVLNYADGRKIEEDLPSTSKTVQGRYIVSSFQSHLYNSTIHGILTYDPQASAYKIWGLYGSVVTEGMMVVDSEKKTTAMTSSYVGGFTELSIGSFSESGSVERTWVYQNGKLYSTRDVTIKPVEPAK